jgi:hypothetical protein
MHTYTITIAAALAVASWGAAASAQGGQTGRAHSETAADYAELASLIGVDVEVVQPPAGATEAPMADKAKAENPMGEVEDILVNAETGELEWAVIAFEEKAGMEGKTIAVPFSELSWKAKEPRGEDKLLCLQATAAQLRGLPEYDLDAARKHDLDGSVAVVEKSWIAVRDASGEKAHKAKSESGEAGAKKGDDQPHLLIAGRTFAVFPHRLIPATQIAEYDVYAQNEKFGSLSKSLVNCATGRLEFAVLGHGGVAGIGDKEYLVPYEAMDLCQCTDDKDELVFHVHKTTDELKNAGVQYEKPKDGQLDPGLARRAHEELGG